MDVASYTGHVEPDGPWQDRRDGGVLLRKLSVESFDNNVYVVGCARTNAAVLVDVAARPDRLAAALEDFDPVVALQTHGHWDHIRAWGGIRDGLELPVWGHPDDGDLFPRSPDRHLADGQTIEVGALSLEVIHIPGHTEGSVLLLVSGDERPHLLSGDTLFPGGHGRTTTPEDHERIMDGLEQRIFARLPDETWVYPGHGDDTTLGAERPHLAEWRERGW